MSREKAIHEARRWLQQAEADVRAAGASRRSGSCEWACFQAQQAGEKALKAVRFVNDADPWGHSLLQLVQGFPLPEVRGRLAALEDAAKGLDKLYIPTRYPNGLPDLIPADVYTDADAAQALRLAGEVIAGTLKELPGEDGFDPPTLGSRHQAHCAEHMISVDRWERNYGTGTGD